MESVIVVAIIAAVSGGITTFGTLWLTRRFGIPTDLEDRLVDLLKENNSELKNKADRLERELAQEKAELKKEKARTGRLEIRVADLEFEKARLVQRVLTLEEERNG